MEKAQNLREPITVSRFKTGTCPGTGQVLLSCTKLRANRGIGASVSVARDFESILIG